MSRHFRDLVLAPILLAVIAQTFVTLVECIRWKNRGGIHDLSASRAAATGFAEPLRP